MAFFKRFTGGGGEKPKKANAESAADAASETITKFTVQRKEAKLRVQATEKEILTLKTDLQKQRQALRPGQKPDAIMKATAMSIKRKEQLRTRQMDQLVKLDGAISTIIAKEEMNKAIEVDAELAKVLGKMDYVTEDQYDDIRDKLADQEEKMAAIDGQLAEGREEITDGEMDDMLEGLDFDLGITQEASSIDPARLESDARIPSNVPAAPAAQAQAQSDDDLLEQLRMC